MTRRELDALAYLKSRANLPPSLAELANHLGVSQTRAAFLLRALASKGVIVRENGRHRAVGGLLAAIPTTGVGHTG
jgi:DNA-binding MarR family transcriptional regulator